MRDGSPAEIILSDALSVGVSVSIAHRAISSGEAGGEFQKAPATRAV